jgi:hypothetical protein
MPKPFILNIEQFSKVLWVGFHSFFFLAQVMDGNQLPQPLTLPQILELEDMCEDDQVQLSRATWFRVQFHANTHFDNLTMDGASTEEISEAVVKLGNWIEGERIRVSTGIAASGESNRPTDIPEGAVVSDWMFRPRPPEYFWGWENHWLMLDGMPARAPTWGVQPIPGRRRGHNPRNVTCWRWYNHLYRGRADPCEYDGHGECRFVHALPSFPG